MMTSLFKFPQTNLILAELCAPKARAQSIMSKKISQPIDATNFGFGYDVTVLRSVRPSVRRITGNQCKRHTQVCEACAAAPAFDWREVAYIIAI